MTDREHHRRCIQCKHIQAVHYACDEAMHKSNRSFRCWVSRCDCVLYTPDHTLKYLIARKLRLVPSIKE